MKQNKNKNKNDKIEKQQQNALNRGLPGSTPKFSMAHHLPVRPMPDCTSSQMSRMPCWVHSSRSAGKKSGESK
jgi:hypothetical protein